VVRELRVADLSPEESFLGDVLPALQQAMPRVIVTAYAVLTGPDRYYRIDLTLDQPIAVKEGGRLVVLRGCRYRAELWPDGQRTIVRSSVDLDVQLPRTRCGLANRLIERIGGRLIAEAEAGILHRAKAKMRGLAANANNGEG